MNDNQNPLTKNRDAYEKMTSEQQKEAAKNDVNTLGGCFGMIGCAVVVMVIGFIVLNWVLNTFLAARYS